MSFYPHLKPSWKHLPASHLSCGAVAMAPTAAPDFILWHLFHCFDTVTGCKISLNCWTYIWNVLVINIFLLFHCSLSLSLCPSLCGFQGASALFDMIEYYESATHLNISFNKHIGTRGWQAAAHMMRKVRDTVHNALYRRQQDITRWSTKNTNPWDNC